MSLVLPGSASCPPAPLVLVVENDPEMRSYIRESLDAVPARTLEAADGRDALDQLATLASDPPALVITDLLMPHLGGRALKAALHADPRWTHVPVLIVTGEATRARDGPVLRKPFNGRRLCAAVHALLAP